MLQHYKTLKFLYSLGTFEVKQILNTTFFIIIIDSYIKKRSIKTLSKLKN